MSKEKAMTPQVKAMTLPCPFHALAGGLKTGGKGQGKVNDRSMTVPPFQGQGKVNAPQPDSMAIQNTFNEHDSAASEAELLAFIMELEGGEA